MESNISSPGRCPVRSRQNSARRKTYTGGKKAKRGTPQGGAISPLLANIVTYADDLVVLCRHNCEYVRAQGHEAMDGANRP